MINIDKDYLITVDLKNTKVKSDKTIFFYNTDLNICNIFIKLICTDEDKTIPEDLIVEFAVLKPETDEFKPLDATLISKEDLLYQVDLTTDYFDIIGKYECEIRVSGTIENELKCFTSEEFDYVVKPNITAKLNKKIKNDKNLPVLEKLIKDVKEITDGINKNEIQMKRDENLVGDNKTIVGAINQLREDVNSGGKVELKDYQKKTDDNLATEEKTIVGAVNEINSKTITLEKDDTSFDGVNDTIHDNLTTTDKRIIGAINEVNAQYKDIANNFTTEQTNSSFIIKYGEKVIATIPLSVIPSSKYAKLKGKSWSILGDSLSAYNITPVPLKYWKFVSDEAEGMELHHYGIEGQRIYQFTERYKNMNESDIITVLGGINDYFANTTLGTITDDSVRTFYGALNVLARGLKTNFPNSLIIFITPMKAKSVSDTDVGHNFKGVALESYIQAIKDVCTTENLPCIDLYDLDIITWDNIDTRTYDGLHWEQETYELVAQVLLDEFIKHNIPSINDDVAVQSISLTDSNVSIFEGNRKVVTTNVLPATAGNKLIHWSTDNPNIATVEDGMITGVGLGNCIITAKTDDGGQSASCNVEVVQQTKDTYTAYVIPKDDGGCMDLGYAPSAGDNIDFVFSDSEASKNALKVYFGHRYFLFGRSKNTLETMYINNGASAKEVDAHSYKMGVYDTKCSIGMYTDGLYYNNVKITSTVIRDNNYSHDDYNMYLFGYNFYNDGKTINPTKYKFYALRVTNNNILTHEFVAYKDEKGIPCVYDKVSHEYHYPKDGGSLQFGNDTNTPCTSISLNKTEITLDTSNPVEIKCTPIPITTTDSIIWTTSKDSIAKVIDNKIIGTGLGNCIITVTCGNQSTSCNVTVNAISEYEEYKKYIDVTGKCVVDTGYTRMPTDDIQLIFKDTDDSYTNSEVYFGSINTVIGRANNQPTKFRAVNNLSASNGGCIFDSILNKKTSIKLGQNGIYIDGILKYCYTTTNNVSVGTVADAKTLTLFAQNYYDAVENAINHSNYRFYALTVIDSITGDIKHDFVPKEDSNGKVCIYDRMTGNYHYDVKGGTLTLGTD